MSKLKYKKFEDEPFSSNEQQSASPTSPTTTPQAPILTPEHTNVYLNERNCNRNGSMSSNRNTVNEEVTIRIVPNAKSGYEEFSDYIDIGNVPFREKVRRFVENIVFRLFTIVLIITDCLLLIVDIAIGPKDNEQETFDFIALCFVSFFVLEVCVRIYAHTIEGFFRNIYNVVDFVVILISFCLTLICILIDLSNSIKLVALGRLIRVVVLIRLIRVFYTEPHNIRKGARNVVSENKRRYRDGEFDLDLTYITDNVIGMSFPSSGRMAVYRNNINEVKRFFDTRHGAEHYKVYNLCSEKSYDTSYFHGRVSRYPIDDHNVPSLEQMLDFVKDVESFLSADEKNVVAVHCKGGKGRTGTMICAWMVHNQHFTSAKEALDYFAERRTDKTLSDKFQGVETPSQSRYVEYFTKVIYDFNRIIPPKRQLILNEIKIYGINNVGNGDGSDMNCEILIDRKQTFSLCFNFGTNCAVKLYREKDVLSVTPLNCPPLVGDVRLKFNSKSKKVPVAYEKCAFYFWFNTSFVDQSNMLRIERNDLDNPHKSKTWDVYRENFAVELYFKPH